MQNGKSMTGFSFIDLLRLLHDTMTCAKISIWSCFISKEDVAHALVNADFIILT